MASTATREAANKEEGAIVVRNAVDRAGAKVDRHKDNSAVHKLHQDQVRLLPARVSLAAIKVMAIVHAAAVDEVVVAVAGAASSREHRA